MSGIRLTLIAAGLSLGLVLNLTIAPQIMTSRPPVFNGADIAENWEWRSMAIESHSWWLWEQFPEARVVNAGFVTPPGNPDALPVGMKLEQWVDDWLTTEIDTSLPPLDVSELGIRDELYAHHKVYSRIHCRSGQEMERRDTCYYFVAWAPHLLSDGPPTFIGVETNRSTDEEEMALIERNLLQEISPVPISAISTIDEIRAR